MITSLLICLLSFSCEYVPDAGHPHHTHHGPSHPHKHHGGEPNYKHVHPIPPQFQFRLKEEKTEE